MSLNIQPVIKLSLDKESDISSTAVTVSNASTVSSEVDPKSQPLSVGCPITELPPKMPPLPKISLPDISQMRSAGHNKTNISQRLPFPILPVPPPSQTNTSGFGTCQGGVGYYTHFGGQSQAYLINGLNQCIVSSPNQNASILSAASANFAQDPVLQPLRTPPALEARNCQIGMNDKVHISNQFSVPPPVNAPLTDMLQRAGPISPLPVFDAKSFQTATNFSCFGFQKLPRYASETSSLSSMSSSVSSASSKPSLCGPPFSVHDYDAVSIKGSTNTTQMPPLGVMSAPLKNNLCSNNGTAQNLSSINNAKQGFTLSDSSPCPKQRLPVVAVSVNNIVPDNLPVSTRDPLNSTSLEQDVVNTRMSKSLQCINSQFPTSHRNGVMSTTGNVNNAAQSSKVSRINFCRSSHAFVELLEGTLVRES